MIIKKVFSKSCHEHSLNRAINAGRDELELTLTSLRDVIFGQIDTMAALGATLCPFCRFNFPIAGFTIHLMPPQACSSNARRAVARGLSFLPWSSTLTASSLAFNGLASAVFERHPIPAKAFLLASTPMWE